MAIREHVRDDAVTVPHSDLQRRRALLEDHLTG